MTSDSFQLAVSDGMHKIPIKVPIVVKPVDDEQPLLAAPIDGTLDALEIQVDESGTTVITSKVFANTFFTFNGTSLFFNALQCNKLSRLSVQ